MSDWEDRPGDDSDRVVERGETFEHNVHGQVEVTGIWKGVQQVDNARHVNEKETIIVRYSADQAGEQVDELTDTLDECLDATE
ncbi:hypothetical protein [Halovivax sp.]|uniref:hypothetical protein n=1 Tax=Halovivax sp. TaxID=1935978 RepID=UPI0025BBCD17|nr:hypothetical protein [Halovivax sp.]